MKKQKTNHKWVIQVTLLSFMISVFLGVVTSTVVNDLNIIISLAVLILVILLGILFDIIGLAVATATEVPFHAKSTKRHVGAKESIKLIRNAEKVSSFCNDVIGDISGVISGGLAASIVVNIGKALPFVNTFLLSLLLTAIVASMTIGGKAYCKPIAMTESYAIVEKCGIFIYRLTHLFALNKRKEKSK